MCIRDSIQTVKSSGATVAVKKDEGYLREDNLALLDYEALFLELERFKRERGWHNLNIIKEDITALLGDNTWYLSLIHI